MNNILAPINDTVIPTLPPPPTPVTKGIQSYFLKEEVGTLNLRADTRINLLEQPSGKTHTHIEQKAPTANSENFDEIQRAEESTNPTTRLKKELARTGGEIHFGVCGPRAAKYREIFSHSHLRIISSALPFLVASGLTRARVRSTGSTSWHPRNKRLTR